MTVINWFHCFCGGPGWRQATEEHLWGLARAGFQGEFRVGLVGTPDQRAEALQLIVAQRPPVQVVEADAGWEQVTLKPLRALARRRRDDLTLYCHTKGASNPNQTQDAWRRSMTAALLPDLGVHAQTLSMIYEAVGCHWLDPLPSGGRGFGGNFWLATNRFLATLPPVGMANRHQAESWIGSGERPPTLLDVNPGYPGEVPWVHRIGWPK